MEVIIDECIAINYRGNDRNDLMHIITNIDIKSEHKSELSDYVSPSAQKILTSEFNALFLKRSFDIENCHGMELNSTFTFQVGKKQYDCTFLDSKFSLGSIAVLIQGRFGTALYTGYFCYYPAFSRSTFTSPFLQKKLQLNYLYLDATYYEQPSEFTGLHENVQKIIELIEIYKTKRVFIYAEKHTMDPVICELASRLNELVYVDKSRMETLELLGYEQYFTTDISKSRISIAKGYLHKKGKACDQDLVIVFHRHEKYTTKFLPCSYTFRNIYFFHFYCHSNHAECCRLISELKPDHLIPIQPPLIDPSKIKFTPVSLMGCKSFNISTELNSTKESVTKPAKTYTKTRQKKMKAFPLNESFGDILPKKKSPLEIEQDAIAGLVIEATFSLQDEIPAFNMLKVRNPSEINKSFELKNFNANETKPSNNDQCLVSEKKNKDSKICPEYLLPSTSKGIAVTSNFSGTDISRIINRASTASSSLSETIGSLPQFKKLREVLPNLEDFSKAFPIELSKSEHKKLDKPEFSNLSYLKMHTEPIFSEAHDAKLLLNGDNNSSCTSTIKSKNGEVANNIPLNSKNIRSQSMENRKLNKSSIIKSKELIISTKVMSSVNDKSENSDKLENTLLLRLSKSVVSSEQPLSKKVRSYIILSNDKKQTKKNSDVITKKVIPELYPITSLGQNINKKTNPLWAQCPVYDRRKRSLKDDLRTPKLPKVTDDNKTILKESQQSSDLSSATNDGDKTEDFSKNIKKKFSDLQIKECKTRVVKSKLIVSNDKMTNCSANNTMEQNKPTSCINSEVESVEHDFKNDISNCSILSIPEANASSIDRALELIMNQQVDLDSTDVSNLVYGVYDILEVSDNNEKGTCPSKTSISKKQKPLKNIKRSSRVGKKLVSSKTSEKFPDNPNTSNDKNICIAQNNKNIDTQESNLNLDDESMMNDHSLTERMIAFVDNKEIISKIPVEESSSNLKIRKLFEVYRMRDCYVHLNKEDINRFYFYSKTRKCYVSKDYGFTRRKSRQRQDFMMMNKFLGLVKKLRQKAAESYS